MKLPHFLSAYRKQSKELLKTHGEKQAMSLAVGGDYEAVGALEFCLLKQLGLQPRHTVIDAGCGSGRLATQLKDYLTGTFIGLDVVPELFRYAEQACGRPDWKFYQAPGTTFPERDSSADFITFFSVFTHLQHEEMYRYLEDARRALKPDGKIVFSFLEFRIPSHWFIFENSVKDARPDKVLNQFIDRDMIREFAAHLDLEIAEIHDGHIPHIALDRPVRWDSGHEMHGMGNLGQSVCVLTHKRADASNTAGSGQHGTGAQPAAVEPRKVPTALIDDPTAATLPGCSVTLLSEENIPRRCDIQFWDDPFDTGMRKPRLGDTVSMKRYVLELDSSWTLDGHRFFVHPEAGFIADRVIEAHERNRLLATDADTSLSLDPESGQFLLETGTKAKAFLQGRIGVATSVEPSNWGSFLTRIVPKAIALRDAGCSKLLVYCHHPRQLELIKLIGWKDDEIIPLNPGVQYVMGTAVYPSEWTNSLYLHPDALALLQRLPDYSENAGRKIYVSRRRGVAANSGRACLNADEVEIAMKGLGLEIVVPDLLSTKEQIDLFASAQLVVGPSGAGMFNTVFCRAGTALVDIESQPDWIWGHANLFSSIGLDFGMCLAKAEAYAGHVHRPYHIDVAALADRVRSRF